MRRKIAVGTAVFLGVGAAALGGYTLAKPPLSDVLSALEGPGGAHAAPLAPQSAQLGPEEAEEKGAEGVEPADPEESAQSTKEMIVVYDVDSPDSLTTVVNKQRPMGPLAWAPDDLVLPQGIGNEWGHVLRAEAAQALEEMHAAASAAGAPFIITSGYRSYDTQLGLYASYAARSGEAAADTYSARAGFSEHQTGLAVDLHESTAYCYLQSCFEETATGAWLREHAPDFGFILRYPLGETDVVGYKYEPWHFRYVGRDVALAMREAGEVNLETFLGLPPAPGY